jgi:hypothetical protein
MVGEAEGFEVALDGYLSIDVLSDEKIVAQLDCKGSTDGDKAILNKIAKGGVKTSIASACL